MIRRFARPYARAIMDVAKTPQVAAGVRDELATFEQARAGARDLQELYAKLPVVVYTGQAEPAAVVPLLPVGARYYLQKPIEPNALIAAVNSLIG